MEPNAELELAKRALEQYSLGAADIEDIKTGHNNRHFLVSQGGHKHVLRLYRVPGQTHWNRRVRTPASIEYEHAVLAFAAERSFPCAPAIVNRAGRTVTSVDGSLFALFPYMGAQTGGYDAPASVSQAAMLARLHNTMDGFGRDRQHPHRGLKLHVAQWFHQCEQGVGTCGELVAWAHTIQPQTDSQKYAAENAGCLSGAMAAMEEDICRDAYETAPLVVNHGDFRPANIGMADGAAAVVYDFDDCSLDHPTADLAHMLWHVACDDNSNMDVERARLVVRAYRDHRPLPPRALALYPYFVVGELLHFCLGMYGTLRLKPEIDNRWLNARHLEVLKWHLARRHALSEEFGRM